MQKVLYYGPVSSTGDGLRMAQALGVKTQLLQYGKRYPNGIEIAPGKAKSTIYANVGAFDQSGILVNVDGQRFVNEKASNRHILEPVLKNRNGQAYVFMDAKSWAGFLKRLPETGVSQEDAMKYLAADGKTPPLFVKGDTVDEVAPKAGIDAAALKATIERYNGFVKAKKDDDFLRPAPYMKGIIADEGPYYIVEQKPRLATTMGGVMCDDSSAGANVGWALTPGRVAADAMAEALKAGR